MAKFALVVARDPRKLDKHAERVLAAARAVTPASIRASIEPRVHELGAHALLGVTSGAAPFLVSEDVAVLGQLFEGRADPRPGAPLPEGTYALVRHDGEVVEVSTDASASRGVWYFKDEDVFIAASSQRLIVMMTGRFERDEQALPWQLSTGTLGPSGSWDARISKLEAQARVTLDVGAWTTAIEADPIRFEEAHGQSVEEQRRKLEALLDARMKVLAGWDEDAWVLSLSGGYDSRSILEFMSAHADRGSPLRTITWGSAAAASGRTDAAIAARLATRYGTEHEFLTLDDEELPFEEILRRFVWASEGAVDHIAGYMDGMRAWEHLSRRGVNIIRGDEGFGWLASYSELDVRAKVGCLMCADIKELSHLGELPGWPRQVWPVGYERRQRETLQMWRDRLYHQFRLPLVLSALSDIKYSYTEQVNPLLSPEILSLVRQQPDTQREEKRLFREILDSKNINVPYATEDATVSLDELLKRPDVRAVLRGVVETERAQGLYGDLCGDALRWLDAGSSNTRTTLKGRLKKELKRRVPGMLKKVVKGSATHVRVSPSILVLRMTISCLTDELLSEDARRLS